MHPERVQTIFINSGGPIGTVTTARVVCSIWWYVNCPSIVAWSTNTRAHAHSSIEMLYYHFCHLLTFTDISVCWDPQMKVFILGISTGLIFTLMCEDMPETQLWATTGQWDRHPWPANKTHLLPLFTPLVSRDLYRDPLSLLPTETLLSSLQSSHQESWALKGSSSGLQLLRAASCSSNKQRELLPTAATQGPV